MSLVVWSVVLGFVLNLGISIFTFHQSCPGAVACFGDVGYPISYAFDANALAFFLSLNTFIWIFLVFIILSLIRYFRIKKV